MKLTISIIVLCAFFLSSIKGNASDEALREKLDKANKIYRLTGGDSGLTDREYDYLKSLLKEKASENQVGIKNLHGSEKLPRVMGSLNKVKTIEQIKSWCQKKGIESTSKLAISPKFDGIAIALEFKNGAFKRALTRGDGTFGRNVTKHLLKNPVSSAKLPKKFNGIVIGELVMSKKVFAKKYSRDYKNERNIVAGFINRKEVPESMKDLDFIAFSIHGKEFESTIAEWHFCNLHINHIFNYVLKPTIFELGEINREKLQSLSEEEIPYLCDGLVLNINSKAEQIKLGREENSLNPAFARAWKPITNSEFYCEVKKIDWCVSKSGALKPVIVIKPTSMEGVVVSRVTGNNAAFIKKNKLATGAHISIIRSGSVIPKMVKVLLPAQEGALPNICYSCQTTLSWNKTGVELLCRNNSCPEKCIAENIHFAKKLGIRGMGEGLVRQLYKAGYCDAKAILNLSETQLKSLDGFQERKAHKIYNSIQKAIASLNLAKLQYASSFFHGIGEKKLRALTKFNNLSDKPQCSEIVAMKGFSKKTAELYLSDYESFWNWQADLPTKVKKACR